MNIQLEDGLSTLKDSYEGSEQKVQDLKNELEVKERDHHTERNALIEEFNVCIRFKF
jgi:hypothetical protein